MDLHLEQMIAMNITITTGSLQRPQLKVLHACLWWQLEDDFKLICFHVSIYGFIYPHSQCTFVNPISYFLFPVL